MHIRLSVPADIPVLRNLWVLAFGDGGAYLDNFFDCYYRPERMIVLEQNGEIRAMTAWFDTTFLLPDQGEFRAAYLYAVTTHPDCRGQGLAGHLFAWADDYFRTLNIPVVTTVPAEPSLHNFFASHGFEECFFHDELTVDPADRVTPDFVLNAVTPAAYGELRESLLLGTPHIRYPLDALTYQAGCCHVSGGGLYAADTEAGVAILCAEGMADGSLLVKELLGTPQATEKIRKSLSLILPKFSGICRLPGKNVPFGMVKWLVPGQENVQKGTPRSYLGLAFD